MTLESFEELALSATLAQFDAGQFHDSDFAAFRTFRSSSVSVILDVGANRGQSIASLRTVFAQASIHAFEANPVFFNVLTELGARLPGPLHVHRYGLGRERATLQFHIPWVGDIAYLEESSTHVQYFEKPWVVDKYRQRGTLRLEEIVVDVRAGDEFGLIPDIVKIDVEGAEHDVLVGLRQTIEATHPSLLVENSDWHNVTPLLRELGYEPYRWEPTEQTLVPYYGATTNTFYVHSGRLVDVPVR